MKFWLGLLMAVWRGRGSFLEILDSGKVPGVPALATYSVSVTDLHPSSLSVRNALSLNFRNSSSIQLE